MDGTVRGAFDLDVGPAVRGVREYRREAARADTQTRQLGATIDRSFSREQVTRIRQVSQATRDLGRDTGRTRIVVRREWEGMRRDIDREAARIHTTIDGVRSKLRELGRERFTPQVDVTGIARAISQVEVLQARLAALNATRVSAGVGVGGGGIAGAGGVAGRGGGGSAMVNLGSVGFAGLRGGTLLAGGALALPAVQALAGGATGVVASAGAAGLGAGATGLGGLAPLVAGIGAVMSVAKPANAALEAVTKQQDKLTEAIREHGRASQQAQEAERELNRLRRLAGPGAGYAAGQQRAFGREWRELTAPARQQWFGFRGDTMQTARRVAPLLADNARIGTTAVRQSGGRFVRHLAGEETQGNLAVFTRAFARELPTAERTLENVSLTMQRLARASIPFFHDANVWVRNWTRGWRDSTGDISGTRARIGELVESAKDWRDLTGSTFRLLRDIFRLGRPSGDSLVVSLTRTFDRWDAWINTHPEQVRDFFAETADSVRGMGTALSGVVGWLNEMATVLRPLLDRFSQLAGLVSSLGLIGAPGAIAALVGGYRGFRGSAGGAAGGGGAMAGPGGAVLAGALAGGVVARGGRVSAAAAARVHPLAAPRVGQLVHGEGFRYGGPVSQLGPRTTRFGSGLNRAGAAARGAGRAFLPLALGLGALDFASFDGGFGDRTAAALSGATLGIVPRPMTGDEHRDRGLSAANDVFGGLDRMRGGPRAQIRELERPLRHLDAYRRREGELPDFLRDIPIAGRNVTLDDPRQISALRDALRDELTVRRELVREMDRERERRLDDRARQRALQYGAGIPAAFRTFRRAGQSREEAMGSTVDQIRSQLGRTRDAGVETLGEASLAWANALAKRNPELKGQVDELTESIERRFRRMGQRVAIVNGDILTGSKSEWRQIRDAMSDPMEQARQRVMDDFTAIQNKAVASLTMMGYTTGDARSIVQGRDPGASPGQRTYGRAIEQLGPGGAKTQRRALRHRTGADRARGGMIGGAGMMDTVPMPDGGRAAPGEAWIANRHTLSQLSQATRAVFGLTAQQMIAGESRPHWMPGGSRYALGGEMPTGRRSRGVERGAASGGLMGANPGLWPYAQDAARFGLWVSSGLRPGSMTRSGNLSHHASGWALDFAGSPENMMGFARHAARAYGRRLEELIYSPLGYSIKNGRRVAPYAVSDHFDHVHLADVGGARGGLVGGGIGLEALAGGGAGRIRLRGLGQQQGGVPGAMRERAGSAYAAGLERLVNDTLARHGGGGGLGGGSAQQRIARAWRRAGGSNPRLAAAIAMAESSGNPNATSANPAGGQNLGWFQIWTGHHDSTLDEMGNIRAAMRISKGGRDWSAWEAFTNGSYRRFLGDGWGRSVKWAGAFDRGGAFTTDGPTAFVAGEGPRNRRERVTITPARGGGNGVVVNFHPGSVVVKAGAGGDVDDATAEKVGEKVVRKIIEAIDRGTAATDGVID